MSVSERTTRVEDLWTMVTLPAPHSQRSTQMSCAEVLEPITTQRFPDHASPLR